MKTLADAQNWYLATKEYLGRMQRLGERHWNDPSMEKASIWQDNQFKELTADKILAETTASLQPIDDLAVVVLFSVFEATVRDYLIELISPEAIEITDPILKEAADEAIRGVADGSFYRRVLEPLKNQGHVAADLVTQVNQVRDYRNWVAHGRREFPTNKVTPKQAFSRLREFLVALGIADELDQDQLNLGE